MTGLNEVKLEEKQCLQIFLHHYNAEQGRNFQCTHKLDVIDRSMKMPDFLCSDGSDYLIVEVTSVYFDLQELKWDKGWHDITKEVKSSTKTKIPPGVYGIKTSYPFKWEGGQSGKQGLIDGLSDAIQKYTQGMKVGETRESDTPVYFKLTKVSDTGNDVLFFHIQVNAPVPPYIEEVFCPVLAEANEKFANAKAKYPNAASILLIENRNWYVAPLMIVKMLCQ
ncbi:hypothetical protein HYR99_19090 [Candidatus Poribacteria bacterium]|nr:hypothetical protein [Candidatus Poribacteria bacterium]